jgi:protein gp37
MNKTKIEWTDYTWNPVTGCWGPGGMAEKPNRCSYCYAVTVARRFNHHQIMSARLRLGADPFEPTFHPDRLDQPAKVKKPSKIFVCSMADLLGDWVPGEWIHQIIEVAENCPQHIFQFLTKNPKRLSQFPWPSNCWVGTTVTNQGDADERWPWILRADGPVRFVSHEPLLGPIILPAAHLLFATKGSRPFVDWAIIGAMTGPGRFRDDITFQPGWVQDLIDQYRAAGIPVFLKDNLNWLEKIQEWPT